MWQQYWRSCLVIGVLGWCINGAAEELVLPQPVTVFAKPDESSASLNLPSQTSIDITPLIIGDWQKVRFSWKNKTRGAFLKKAQISSLRSVQESQADESMHYLAHRFGFGGGFEYTYYAQNATIVNTEGGSNKVSGLSGTSPGFQFFFDYRIAKRNMWHFGIMHRQVEMSGEIEPLSTNVTTEKSKILRDYALLGLSAEYRTYFGKKRLVWWGGGLEFAMVQKISIAFKQGSNVEKLPTENSDATLFVIPEMAVGIDVPIGRHWFVLPKLQIGVFANAHPLIVSSGLGVNIGYAVP